MDYTNIANISTAALQPVIVSIDNLQKEGVPVKISLEFFSFLMLLFIVCLPVVLYSVLNKK